MRHARRSRDRTHRPSPGTIPRSHFEIKLSILFNIIIVSGQNANSKKSRLKEFINSPKHARGFCFFDAWDKVNLGNEISRNSFLGQSSGCVSDCK